MPFLPGNLNNSGNVYGITTYNINIFNRNVLPRSITKTKVRDYDAVQVEQQTNNTVTFLIDRVAIPTDTYGGVRGNPARLIDFTHFLFKNANAQLEYKVTSAVLLSNMAVRVTGEVDIDMFFYNGGTGLGYITRTDDVTKPVLSPPSGLNLNRVNVDLGLPTNTNEQNRGYLCIRLDYPTSELELLNTLPDIINRNREMVSVGGTFSKVIFVRLSGQWPQADQLTSNFFKEYLQKVPLVAQGFSTSGVISDVWITPIKPDSTGKITFDVSSAARQEWDVASIDTKLLMTYSLTPFDYTYKHHPSLGKQIGVTYAGIEQSVDLNSLWDAADGNMSDYKIDFLLSGQLNSTDPVTLQGFLYKGTYNSGTNPYIRKVFDIEIPTSGSLSTPFDVNQEYYRSNKNAQDLSFGEGIIAQIAGALANDNLQTGFAMAGLNVLTAGAAIIAADWDRKNAVMGGNSGGASYSTQQRAYVFVDVVTGSTTNGFRDIDKSYVAQTLRKSPMDVYTKVDGTLNFDNLIGRYGTYVEFNLIELYTVSYGGGDLNVLPAQFVSFLYEQLSQRLAGGITIKPYADNQV